MHIKSLFLVLIISISGWSFGQNTNKLPGNELREIVKSILDFPELQQYFHVDTKPERIPIKLKEHGEITPENLKGIKKFETEVQVLNSEELKQKNITDYLGFADWTHVNDKLRIQLTYPIEGITLNLMLERKKTGWKIVSSELWEE